MSSELAKLDSEAAAIIERGIHSHVVWRDFLAETPGYPTNDVGDVLGHEKWIRDYQYLEALLIKALGVDA